MDSRKCSAAAGFTLLIGCVIGIVILIHNSGSSRRSSDPSSSSLPVQHNHQLEKHPYHRASSTTVVGGKPSGDHFSSSPKEGFSNDPNYRSSQPTMQEVNELADELRLLSAKSKHVLGMNAGKGSLPNAGIVAATKKTNGSLAVSTSATSSAKASITAVNYSSVPRRGPLVPSGGSGKSSLTSSRESTSTVNNVSQPPKSLPGAPPLSTPGSKQEKAVNHEQDLPTHHHNQKLHPGQSSPGGTLPMPDPTLSEIMGESVALPDGKKERGGSGDNAGGLSQNDLYTTSWHPSMISAGSMGDPSHSYQHILHPHPSQTHFPHNKNNNLQQRRPSSPAIVNKTGKGTGHLFTHNRVASAKNAQQGHHQHDYEENQEKEEMITDEEDGDFVDDDDDTEDIQDDLYETGENVKKVGSEDNDEEVDDEEAEEDEDDYDTENSQTSMQPKNFAADLETLFSLANNLYTSPASLLSTLSMGKVKANSMLNGSVGHVPAGFPAALQGFLKVVNETIQRGNNSKLLVELNERYRGREAKMTEVEPVPIKENRNSRNMTVNVTSSGLAAKEEKTPYEKSLTSLVFMSFGVFLLNQIHNFVQKTADNQLAKHNLIGNSSRDASEGRALSWEDEGPFKWYSPKGEMLMTTEPSSLDILFQPPISKNMTSDRVDNASEPVSGRSSDFITNESATSTEDHVNNMFRAMLNIGNAYSQDSPALECIWSLYCQDLDNTSQKSGLYGVAARINSVGLRLIMDQIPVGLTFDVILRSLVGWDGLPCKKMFPQCSVSNGTISMTTVETVDAKIEKIVSKVL